MLLMNIFTVKCPIIVWYKLITLPQGTIWSHMIVSYIIILKKNQKNINYIYLQQYKVNIFFMPLVLKCIKEWALN